MMTIASASRAVGTGRISQPHLTEQRLTSICRAYYQRFAASPTVTLFETILPVPWRSIRNWGVNWREQARGPQPDNQTPRRSNLWFRSVGSGRFVRQTAPYAWGGNPRLSSSLLKRHGLYEGTTLRRRNWSALTACLGAEAAQRGFAA